MSTEQQKGVGEAYGAVLGAVLEGAAKLGFMSKEQGAESALWAGTAKSVGERKDEVQGRYFSEADGKVRLLRGLGAQLQTSLRPYQLTLRQVDTESDQAKEDILAKNLWDLSVKVLKEKAGYAVTM